MNRTTLLPVAAALLAFRVLGADPSPARDLLIQAADRALQLKPPSVMDKAKMPPSGDKHDYMSVGPYWWPDPSKPQGLPYIRRDGEVNPGYHSNDYDRRPLGELISAVSTLSLAFRETREERYARGAVKLLRVWFLDPATRMNPNLNFGQAIPGITEGRGIGIIDTLGLASTVQSCQWLETSQAFTSSDRAGLKAWIGAYLDWLLTSKNGREEAAAKNNHGTWYDVQVAAFALYTERPDLARKVAEEAKVERIAAQIEPDGAMPHELARTKSFSYSVMNLRGFFDLADVARSAGVDLWRFQSADGRSVRKALEYLAPYVDPARTWPHEQIAGGVTPEMRVELAVLLRRAALAFGDPKYERIASAAGPGWLTHRAQLIWPSRW